jgi:hypothetical protein
MAPPTEVYWNPIPDMVLTWNRRRRTSLFGCLVGGPHKVASTTYKGYVHVCAIAPAVAPAANLPTALGSLSPSGVNIWRIDS